MFSDDDDAKVYVLGSLLEIELGDPVPGASFCRESTLFSKETAFVMPTTTYHAFSTHFFTRYADDDFARESAWMWTTSTSVI